MSEERAKAEEGEPWFLSDDGDAPDLNVQAGISSNLRPEDLALLQEGVGSGPPTTPREAVRPDRPPLDPSGEAPPGTGPAAPDLPPLDSGQRQGQGAASVFPVPESEPPDLSPPPEPPATNVFDSEPMGPAAQRAFEDPSLQAPEYGERSPGDTLAPPLDGLRTVEAEEFEPKELEASEIQFEEVESEPAPPTPEPEKIDPSDDLMEPRRLQPGMAGDGETLQRADPDITPTFTEPIAANTLDDLRSVLDLPVSEPPAASMFESTEPEPIEPETSLGSEEATRSVFDALEADASGTAGSASADPPDEDEPPSSGAFDLPEPKVAAVSDAPAPVTDASALAANPPDEEPLRSALLQSFKDVVARAPAAPDNEDDGLAITPEQPEPEEFRPRQPPSRPRRF